MSRRQRRGSGAAARGVAYGAGLLKRIVQLVVAVVVLIIVAGTVLVLLKANPANTVVSDVHDAARWLAGPLDGIFSFHSANVTIASPY